MSDHKKFFQENYHKLKQAALHQVFDDTWSSASVPEEALKVLVVRLSPHRDVQESYTHGFLASEVLGAGVPVLVDYAFLPTGVDRNLYDQFGVPWMTGIHSALPPQDFDLLLVSNSYTLEMVNLPILLQQAGLPLWASTRKDADPLVLLGGSNALASQALFRPGKDDRLDCYADGVFFGEAEGVVTALVKALNSVRNEERGRRRDALRQASKGSLWIWGHEGAVTKSVIKVDELTPGLPFPLLNAPGAHRAKLPLSYGCPYFCSFCFEGFEHKPYREISLEKVQQKAQQLRRQQGSLNVDLFSFNFNTHTDIFNLLENLNRQFDDVGFLSQRLDVLNRTPGLLEAEVAADKRTYTLGVEGISTFQRAFYQKGILDEDIMEILGRLLRSKIREIKLFYILSGYENEVDLFEFKTFLKTFQELRRGTNPGIRVIFSFGLLVRMPFTPLGYDQLFMDETAWKAIISETQCAVETHGGEFRLAFSWEEYLLTQIWALMPQTQPLLETMAQKGWCYDRGFSTEAWNWMKNELPKQGFLKLEHSLAKTPDHRFPLDFLTSSFDPDFLYKRYEEARAALLTRGQHGKMAQILEHHATCLSNNCLGCQACQDLEMRKNLLNHGIRPPRTPAFAHTLAQIVKAKVKGLSLVAALRVPENLCGAHPDLLASWITRELYKSSPTLGDKLVRVRELLFDGGGEDFSPAAWFGLGLFALDFRQDEDLRALEALWKEAPPLWRLLQTTAKPADLGWEDFHRYDLRLTLPLNLFPQGDKLVAQWLLDNYLLHTLVKTEGVQTHQFGSRVLSRKFLLSSQITKEKDQWVVAWTAGARFKPGKMFQSLASHGLWRRGHLELLDWS